MDVTGLFPIPVGIKKLEREFSDKEEAFFKKTSKMTYNNLNNLVSTNTHILDEPEMADLHEFCLDSVIDFIKTVNPPKNYLSPYITQSWINYNSQSQGHHRHSHPNSYISGVFYLNAKKEHDKIFFINGQIQMPVIRYTPESYTVFNSEEWFIPVETNMLVLFPSSLQHYVQVNNQPYTRTSLSFNTFIKGSLGENKALTELIL